MRVGIITRHGGQLVDEISRMIGVLELRISFSKLLSSTLTMRMSSSAAIFFALEVPLASACEMPPTARTAATVNAITLEEKLFFKMLI